MTLNIYEKDKIRFQILYITYDLADGDLRHYFKAEDIWKKLDISREEGIKAHQYLLNEGYIMPFGSGYTYQLTHQGQKLVENAVRKIDFTKSENFDNTELYQLRLMLSEIKENLGTLRAGQEVIFNHLDDLFELSKSNTKFSWKKLFLGKIEDLTKDQIIDETAEVLMKAIIGGMKVLS